jgi:P2 family phage contractile tail tube protein
VALQIPERLINFRCYAGLAAEFVGMTDVELPSFEAMTENISGAGIAGEYASPVLGHFGSQVVKLKWRTLTEAALGLLAPARQVLDIRGSIQLQDQMLGALVTKALRVECTGQFKSANLGKLEPGKAMGAEIDVELSTIRISLNDVRIVELDKFNMVFRVFGVDYLAKVRQDMGGL